jgi:hypothetical protein
MCFFELLKRKKNRMCAYNQVHIGRQVVVSGSSLQACIWLGQARTFANLELGRKGIQLSSLTDVQGIVGEWAFHILCDLNRKPLYDTRPRNISNDTFDATISLPHCDKPLTIDVKTIVRKDSPMYVKCTKRNRPADLYVLMHITQVQSNGLLLPSSTYFQPFEPNCILLVTFLGAIPSQLLFHNKYKNQHDTHYCLPQKLLMSLPQALELAQSLSPLPEFFCF